MLNRFQGIGRLGKDPELRYLGNGTPVCNFSLACETSYKSGDEWKKQTFWGDVVFFGARAESIAKYISKGSLVYVEGRLQTRSWDTDSGKRYKTEIIGSDVKFLDNKSKSESESPKEENPPEEHSEIEPF